MIRKPRTFLSILGVISILIAVLAGKDLSQVLLSSNFIQPSPKQQLVQLQRVLGEATSPVATDSAVVKRVIDGDTIELTDGQKVRYIGMDTPELHHPTKGEECFGQAAAKRNEELVSGKTVQLEKDVSEHDRYGRLLRYVRLDGRLINEELISEGYAFARSYPPDVMYQDQFRLAESAARSQNLGLWNGCQITRDHTEQIKMP